jgi:hypothetical protein
MEMGSGGGGHVNTKKLDFPKKPIFFNFFIFSCKNASKQNSFGRKS